MKKKGAVLLACLNLTLLSQAAMAMNHEHAGHGAPAASQKQSGHGDHVGMAMAGATVSLGSLSVKGVAAKAEISDVRAAMRKAGMSATHHLMVRFTDKGGAALNQGTVAVKIAGVNAAVGSPIRMVLMDGSFGTDLSLILPGRYRFEVGSRLPDGENRQFIFHHTVQP